jgi:C_GCAxxG_C_C family probable redox protein
MLLDKVKKYYNKDVYDLNCAETIVYASNEEYNLNLNAYSLKGAAAFGGGMAIEDMCGVVTGALLILGMMFTQERAHESDRIKNLTIEFITRFSEVFGTTNCRQLKTDYRSDEERCSKMVNEGAIILDEIVTRELNK